jgi:hypothetical protein
VVDCLDREGIEDPQVQHLALVLQILAEEVLASGSEADASSRQSQML